MASSSSSLTDEQIQCDNCCNMFTDLVSTSCGHSFCEDCIDTCWENEQLYECPVCMKEFETKPDFMINSALANVVVDQMKLRENTNKSHVLCDVCCGKKLRAVKSCLQCVTSFCETHLDNHKTAPRLMRHKLINPVENLEKYICSSHEKPLEMFCKDDRTSTLISCIETHQSELLEAMEQKQKAAENQAEDLMKDLEQEITELKRRDTELEQLSDIEDHLRFLQTYSCASWRKVLKSWRNISISTDLNTQILKKTLTGLQENVQMEVKTFFETSQASVIQGFNFIPTSESSVSVLGKNTTEPNKAHEIFVFGNTDSGSQLPSLVPKSSSRMKKERVKRLNKDASVPFSTQQDVLEDFSKTKTSNALKEGKIYFTLGKMDKSTHSLSKSVEMDKVKFNGEDLTTIQNLYAVHVVLDPNTSYPKLILSKNGKQVTHGGTWRDVPNNPERFDSSACVLGIDGYSCGRFYFEVNVGEELEWDVGVARESINRKGKITVSPDKGFWTIWLRNGNEYVANESDPICLSLKQKPQKVGVFVDYEKGLVSFYDVEAKCLIYSFTGQSFTEKLYPFLSPCNRRGDANPKPLIISTVSY